MNISPRLCLLFCVIFMSGCAVAPEYPEAQHREQAVKQNFSAQITPINPTESQSIDLQGLIKQEPKGSEKPHRAVCVGLHCSCTAE